MRWHQWAQIAIGIWLLFSPWLLGFSDLNLPTWSGIMAGALTIVFTLWSVNPKQ